MSAANPEQIPGSGHSENGSENTEANPQEHSAPTAPIAQPTISPQPRSNDSPVVRPSESPSADRTVSDLLAAINALPEKITNSVQEALTPPKAQSSSGQTSTVEKPVEKSRRSFVQWWFGDHA